MATGQIIAYIHVLPQECGKCKQKRPYNGHRGTVCRMLQNDNKVKKILS